MTVALWIGPCETCRLTGTSTLTTSCPRCGARALRRDADSEHWIGNHVAGAQKIYEATQLEADLVERAGRLESEARHG